MTVLEAIQRSTEFLARKGVESPRLQTELLLADVLKFPRMKLYLNFERTLQLVELDRLREFIRRRAQREPLQYIIGSTSFCGLDLAVNRHVLIPRPETELLAEFGWRFLNQLCPAGVVERDPCSREREASFASDRLSSPLPIPVCSSSPAVLDFGAGSGCIAITLAVKVPGVQVHALEISAEALELAQQNAAHHHRTDQIQFVQGDGLASLPTGVAFELIISNPPYIPTEDIATLEPEVRDYEPRRALDGGADGLDYFRTLAAAAASFLQPEGRIMLEFGDGQAAAVREIFEREKWIVEAMEEDYTRRPRILIAKRLD